MVSIFIKKKNTNENTRSDLDTAIVADSHYPIFSLDRSCKLKFKEVKILPK